ncbi:hypothetical protein [Pseudomonas sp. RIT623]|uniref:hypothetical protein n=1 Tax=Pseudomonas sp. RIT623 TaxID=2559075 RepID=UPI00106F15E1|nr:hypothetical protein [Pseudomonas sp. RIT623]TFF43229.1 hypothetical protein E3U47_01410 [Pseudomonas sp. RIT623]
MYIETKNWTAQNDKMPGNARFVVSGTVTVGHPGINAELSVRARQDKSLALALDLNVSKADGFFTQVVTDKTVSLELSGDHGNIPKVDIFHDGKLITSITEITETH